jgi:hypothetical protein
MRKIAHIIHPGVVDKSSDLVVAQPITFETMRIACEFARSHVDVQLFAIQYQDEERLPLPGCFTRLPDITRSSRDLEAFKSDRKLALIKDILNPLYNATDADYLIYTNLDIAVLPHFYLSVDKIVAQGFDGFIINRRTIRKRYSQIEEIPLLFAEAGEIHPGSDCFVFSRENYEKFLLGNVVIGCEFIGLTLRTNLAVFSKKFEHFRDLHLTFHIGDDRVWLGFPAESFYNQAELDIIFERMLAYEHVPQPQNLQMLHRHYQKRKQAVQNRLKNQD